MKFSWNTLWNNFKTQPDIWFFYGFLLTFTLTIRKVLFFYPLGGLFNEYTAIYLYLSDLFLIIAFLLFILQYKSYILSIFKTMFHVEHFKRYKTLYIILGFIAWVFISQIWAQIWTIALFRFIKFFELFCLFLYIRYKIVPCLPREMFHACPADRTKDSLQIVPRETIDKKSSGSAGVEHFLWGGNYIKRIFQIIIALGLIQAIIGILQVAFQHSIGLFWFKESLIFPEMPGVAKIILGNHKLIRAYGLFPHPNILGGFLLMTILVTLYYKRLFHPSSISNVPRGTLDYYEAGVTQFNQDKFLSKPRGVPRGTIMSKVYFLSQAIFSSINIKMFHVEHFYQPRANVLIYGVLFVQISAQILTLSKSAIIGTIISFIALYMYINISPQQECSTWNILRARRGTNNIKKISLIILIAIMAVFIAKPDLNSFLFKSFNERLFYLNVSRGTITQNGLLGTGIGQSVSDMQKYTNLPLQLWQFQPVHNVFLLIWNELGIIGLILFIGILWNMFHPSRNVPRLPRCESLFHMEQTFCNWGGTSYRAGAEKFNINGTTTINTLFKSILIGFIFIMLFDHYLWDIQQGEIMLWMVMGFLAGDSAS